MKERLSKILQQIEKLGGDVRPLIFEAPVSFDHVYEIERQLNYKIPDDFKNAVPGWLFYSISIFSILGSICHQRPICDPTL